MRCFVATTALCIALSTGALGQLPRPPKPPVPKVPIPNTPGGIPIPYPNAPRVPSLAPPPAKSFDEVVPKARRALLVVSAGLKKHGDPKYGALYQFLESSGASVSREGLKDVYAEVLVLEGGAGTLKRFLESLYKLAARYDAVDLVLHQHGLPGALVFDDQAITLDDLAKRVTEGASTTNAMPVAHRGHLRMVWETACYGASHATGWQKMGFDAIVGAKAVHADSAASFPAFVAWWKRGYDVLRTTNAANQADPARLLDKWAAGPLGFKDVNSERVIYGNAYLTLGSAPKR